MIRAGVAYSYLLEIVLGIHQPSDEYRVALYTADADIGPDTIAYARGGEAAGPGYAAGGKALAGFAAASEWGVAFITWANPVWPRASVTARAALIYNYTRGNRAVGVADLGRDHTSTNGDFVIEWPEATAETAIIRIGGQ